MDHAHRFEVRIIIPRRAPIRINMDAQDIHPGEREAPPTGDQTLDVTSSIASEH